MQSLILRRKWFETWYRKAFSLPLDSDEFVDVHLILDDSESFGFVWMLFFRLNIHQTGQSRQTFRAMPYCYILQQRVLHIHIKKVDAESIIPHTLVYNFLCRLLSLLSSATKATGNGSVVTKELAFNMAEESDSGSIQSTISDQSVDKKSNDQKRYYALYTFYPNR